MARSREPAAADSPIREGEAQTSEEGEVPPRQSRFADLVPDNPETEITPAPLSRVGFPAARHPKTVWIGCYDLQAQQWRFIFPTDASVEKAIAHFETTFQEAEQLETGLLFVICSFFVDVKDERLKTFRKETRKAVKKLSLHGDQPVLQNKEAYQLVLYLTPEWPEEDAATISTPRSDSGPEETRLPQEGQMTLTEAEAVEQLERLLAEVKNPFAYFSSKIDRILAAMPLQTQPIRKKTQAVRSRLKKITAPPNEILPPIFFESSDALELADQVNVCLNEGREPLQKMLQAYLDRLHEIGTKGFGSFEMNGQVGRKVNQIAADHGMRLLLNDDPVTVRCVRPRGAGSGSFEVRSATHDRRTIQTSTTWPRLVASLRDSSTS